MLDFERLEDKVDEFHRYLKDLEEDLPKKEEAYIQNRMRRRAIEKDFELTCESLIDICNLIIAGKNLQKPSDNKESIQRLYENSIINQETTNKLKNMVGFRNLLVHRYGKIDHKESYQHLKNGIEDLHKFLKRINNYIENEKQ